MNKDNTIAWAIEDLCVNYDHTDVLCHVSFSLPAGAMAAVIGPNGAGKSTLLKASLGLIRASSGQSLFFGQKFAKVHQKIAYMPRQSADWEAFWRATAKSFFGSLINAKSRFIPNG